MLVRAALRLSPGCRAAARGDVLLPGGIHFVCLSLDKALRAERAFRGTSFMLPLILPIPAAALRTGFPGLRGHWSPLHHPRAAGGMLLLLLPLLRELRRPHVPEAGPADGLPAPGALGLCPAGLRFPPVSALAGRLRMEPRGGWKCRRLAAVPGNCHCSRVDRGTAGQRRGSGGGGKLAPGGCTLSRCRPFPTASPRPTGLPRASVSGVPPLWSLSAGHLLGCTGSRVHWCAPDPAGWGLCGWIWRVPGGSTGTELPTC